MPESYLEKHKNEKNFSIKKPFRMKTPALLPDQHPPEKQYCLKAWVISGSDLPYFTEKNVTTGRFGACKKLQIKISIGPDEMTTHAKDYNKGVVRWNELLDFPDLRLPVDTSQIPDIFVYLMVEGKLSNVCFARLKASTLLEQKFRNKSEWILLQEDKVIDALNEGEFPGSVLLKIGFGDLADAQAVEAEWDLKVRLECMRKFLVRVNLYQGRDLPAADSNGLCDPVVYVNFNGETPTRYGGIDGKPVQKDCSDEKFKTLYPTYYQTFDFYSTFCADPEFMPLVTFKLYDIDALNTKEYLGRCSVNIGEKAGWSIDVESQPNLFWTDLFIELPGDTQGSLLTSVIVCMAPEEALPPPESIVPKTSERYIELILLGLRDLAPFNFQAIQNPFLEIECLSADNTKEVYRTKAVKKPSPSNPNFLEHVKSMAVQLPDNPIFALPLFLRVFDTRLGGYAKPEIAVGVIDMSTKIPETVEFPNPLYRPPQSDIFYRPAEDRGGATDPESVAAELAASAANAASAAEGAAEITDPMKKKAIEIIEARKRGNEDDLIKDGTQESPNLGLTEKFITNRGKAVEDSGAGIFGALQHVDMTGLMNDVNRVRSVDDFFADNGDDELSPDEPPKWKVGRKFLKTELEEMLETKPFETYPLYRGKKNAGILGKTLKKVGVLKGLIRVKMGAGEPSAFSDKLISELTKPQGYVVRLYVLEGKGLPMLDVDYLGAKNASDPYLHVTLGDNVFNDRENAQDDKVDIDLYKMIEFNTELPGASQLKLKLMDKDLILSDELIGETHIDLEDRWFDSRWQSEEIGGKATVNDKDPTAGRWRVYPVEQRPLHIPSSTEPRGIVLCWVDILRPAEATAFLPEDIALPPGQLFEVRVVIWKAKDVPAMDNMGGMSDLFCKVWPEGCEPQVTDTHWRAKKGKASWNWRLLFDVELGHSTRAMKFPYLHLQLWDKDIVMPNELAGEGMISMKKVYERAYRKNIAVKMFEKQKGSKLAKQKKEARKAKVIKIKDTKKDVPPKEIPTALNESDSPSNDIEGGGAVGSRSPANVSAAVGSTGSTKNPMLDKKPSGLVRASQDSDDEDEDAGIGALAPARRSSMAIIKTQKSNQAGGSAASAQVTAQAGSMAGSFASQAAGGGMAGAMAASAVNAKMAGAVPALQAPTQTKRKAKGSSWSWWPFGGSKKKSAEEQGLISFDVGDEVEAKFQGGANWFPATITGVNDSDPNNITYAVKFDMRGDIQPPKAEDSAVAVDCIRVVDGADGEDVDSEDDEDEAKEAVTTFKNMTGLWDIDPEDSTWYKLSFHNHNTGDYNSVLTQY